MTPSSSFLAAISRNVIVRGGGPLRALVSVRNVPSFSSDPSCFEGSSGTPRSASGTIITRSLSSSNDAGAGVGAGGGRPSKSAPKKRPPGGARRIDPPTPPPNKSSTHPGKQGQQSSSSSDANRPRNPQDFVKIRFEPGEYDPETHTDPLYMPPYKGRAKVISAEDFANRPTVGFSEEFASLRDARFVLSWMTHETQSEIYDRYLELMENMRENEKGGTTSHEYVVQVLARRYNIMADRVAAIIQLAHNEETIKREHPDFELHHDVARRVDERVTGMIRQVYAELDEVDPGDDAFAEDFLPVGKGSQDAAEVDDSIDLDSLEKRAVLREREVAQRIIDNKVYIEDVDESLMEVKVDRDCRDLIDAKEALAAETKGDVDDADGKGEDATEGRPRWKFVAQTINTREEAKSKKKKKKRHRKDNLIKEGKNTIVEQDGKLRVATVEEVRNTSWKPVRNVKEFMYRDAKKAWIEKTTKGVQNVWGRANVEQDAEADVTKGGTGKGKRQTSTS